MKRIAVVQFKVYSKPQFKHPREVRFVDNGDHDIDYYVAKVKADVKYGLYCWTKVKDGDDVRYTAVAS